MAKRVITPEHDSEMKRLGKTMTAKQISKVLKLNYTTVIEHMSKHAIARKLGKTRRTPAYRRDIDRRGLFNVDAVENWLV